MVLRTCDFITSIYLSTDLFTDNVFSYAQCSSFPFIYAQQDGYSREILKRAETIIALRKSVSLPHEVYMQDDGIDQHFHVSSSV